MPLIAMTREMGSLGMEVAKILEAELKMPVVYHEIIDNLADKMRLRKSHVIKLLGGKVNLFDQLTSDKTSLSIFTADEMLQVASKGVVLRGWGAAHLLRPVRHAICVRVCAPFELRTKRIMQRADSDDYDAIAMEVRNSDEAQRAIVMRHFGLDYRNVELYDVACNTERMSVEDCAEEIVRLARSPRFAETDASRAVLADLSLKAKVRAALRADLGTRGLSFVADAEKGTVTLTGLVGTRDEWNSVSRVVESVPGVLILKNQLRVTSDVRASRA